MSTSPVTRSPRSAASATALVALAACCFGSIAILVTLATRTGAPLVSVLAWRFLLGAVALTVLAGGVSALRAGRGRFLKLIVLGGGGQALIAFTTLYALRFIPVATLVFLFYTYPAWIAFFAVLRRDERVGAIKVAAIALSLGGIAVMVGAPSAASLHPIGVALALASALMYGLYVPFIGRIGSGVPSRAVAALIAAGAFASFIIVGAVASIIPSASRPELALTVALAPAAWLSIVALALVSTALAFVAFLSGLAVLGPVRTAIVSTIEPFWASLLGAVVLQQPIGVPTIAGGAAIAGAVLLLQLPQRDRDSAAVRGLDEPAS